MDLVYILMLEYKYIYPVLEVLQIFPTVPEVLLSSDGQCPQLVSDHLRLWRAHSGGICCSEGLISNSFHMSDKTYQNSRGCISWGGGGGEANIRLVPGNIWICLLCLCAASGLM